MGEIMNIDEYTRITHKNYHKKNKYDDKIIKYLRNLITRILLSIILIISTLIFIRTNDNNKSYLDKYVFQDSLKFTQINKWYQDKFGSLIPSYQENTQVVFGSDNITPKEYEKYGNGIKIKIDGNSQVSTIYGGIVVFIGEKEDFGNTIIIQGNDGINYYYASINNPCVNLLDYIEKDTLIGEVKDYLYLVLEKDGQYIDYDEYLKKI